MKRRNGGNGVIECMLYTVDSPQRILINVIICRISLREDSFEWHALVRSKTGVCYEVDDCNKLVQSCHDPWTRPEFVLVSGTSGS
jgi:hypothetical protein